MSHTTVSIALLALLAGCGVGTSSPDLGVSMALDTALRTAPDADSVGFTVDASSLNVDEIDLHLPAGATCADVDPALLVGRLTCSNAELRIDGPFAVDLAAGTSDPSLDDIALPPLSFRRVDVELAPVHGSTLFASGTRADNGEGWGVVVSFDGEARFEGEIEGASAQSVLLLLDVSGWFAETPLAACLDSGELVATDGVVWLDDHADGACDDFVDQLGEAVKRSGRLAHAGDDDGIEDETEDETEDEDDGDDDTGDDD